MGGSNGARIIGQAGRESDRLSRSTRLLAGAYGIRPATISSRSRASGERIGTYRLEGRTRGLRSARGLDRTACSVGKPRDPAPFDSYLRLPRRAGERRSARLPFQGAQGAAKRLRLRPRARRCVWHGGGQIHRPPVSRSLANGGERRRFASVDRTACPKRRQGMPALVGTGRSADFSGTRNALGTGDGPQRHYQTKGHRR
jgi:hypothetical protein